MLYWEC